MDRREFINKIGRGTLLTGLVAITGYSVIKLISGESSDCPVNTFCSECRKKDNCNSPKKVNEESDERG